MEGSAHRLRGMGSSRSGFGAGFVAALACGTLVTAAMALIAVATALYVAALTVDASALAAEGTVPSEF